ncbi:MAG: hypothetical protein QOI61_1397 [Actinomycetota bacterium]|jgi:hypothetical protein
MDAAVSRRAQGRKRERFNLQAVVDLADLAAMTDTAHGDVEEQPTITELLSHAPQTYVRPPKSGKKRIRPKGRKNIQPGVLELIVALLRTPLFFAIAEAMELPDGFSGPSRQYNSIGVFLWECLHEEIDSFRRMEAFFAGADALVWGLVQRTLEVAWPDHPERRVGPTPMSRHQFHRHRQQLRWVYPDYVDRVKDILFAGACEQAVAMGYMDPDAGSLANPYIGNVARGDGQFHNARFDAIEGDKVEHPVTDVPQYARFDPDATLGVDDDTYLLPGYRFVHFHVADPRYEQEAVLLAFGRAIEGGEPVIADMMLRALKARLSGLAHYLYDMATQGNFANDMYQIDICPITKLARNNKGEPANALIEIRGIKLDDGRTINVPLYGLDGVLCARMPSAGKEFLVPMIPRYLRKRPPHHFVGEYEFSGHPLIPQGIRGKRIHVAMNGLTATGQPRPQYLRWHNEQTELGRELLGQRNSTESQPHSLLEKALDFGRLWSVGEACVTLDLVGFNLARNVRAAMAYERRTGRPPPSTADSPATRAA